MHLNYSKLKRHRDNIVESMTDINKIINYFETEKNLDIDDLKTSWGIEAFRSAVMHIREELFSAVGTILKASNIRVSDFDNNINFIQECVARKIFRPLPREFIKLLNQYRNEAAHRYKQPSTKELLKFHKDNEVYFIQIVEDLAKFLNNANQSSQTRDSRAVQMDLFGKQKL